MVDAPRDGPKPKLDVVGGALSALGLGAIVLGVLQSSTWGLVEPKDSPVAPLGFSLAIWLIGAGVALLYAFVRWQRHRESSGQDPLVHLDLMAIPPLRSGLASLLTQNLILMGIFFVVPLYLQLVLGLDALETGVKMLPVSITMFATSALGSRLGLRYSVRTIIRAGLITSAIAIVVMIAGIDPAAGEIRLQHLDGRAGRRHGPSRLPARATSSSPLWTPPAAARRADCSTRRSSSARRSASRSSAPSSSRA